jgi:hypothetical protein
MVLYTSRVSVNCDKLMGDFYVRFKYFFYNIVVYAQKDHVL